MPSWGRMSSDQRADKSQASGSTRSARWWHRRWKAVLAIATAAVTSAATTLLIATVNFGYSTTKKLITSEPLPFQWILQPLDEGDCIHASYVTKSSPKNTPLMPSDVGVDIHEFAAQERKWATNLGAIETSTRFSLTLQGRSAAAVILRRLRVIIVDRRPPLKGNVYSVGECGAALAPRYFSINLDTVTPSVRPVSGGNAATRETFAAATFPYQISESDPEVFYITARPKHCNCTWYLELEWSSGSRGGNLRIDDLGRPFHTTSETGLPSYFLAPLDDEFPPTGYEWIRTS
jgi:hypothetical protein